MRVHGSRHRCRWLVVVAALTLLSGCDEPQETVRRVSAKQYLEEMRRNTTQVRVRTLHRKAQMYQERFKAYPKNLYELTRQRYVMIRPFDLLDGWSNRLRYRLVDGKPEVCSAGANGKFGDSDDTCRR